jgi:hypothetical protein
MDWSGALQTVDRRKQILILNIREKNSWESAVGIQEYCRIG